MKYLLYKTIHKILTSIPGSSGLGVKAGIAVMVRMTVFCIFTFLDEPTIKKMKGNSEKSTTAKFFFCTYDLL